MSSILEIEPNPREVITTFQYLSKNRPALEKQSPHSNISLFKLIVVCRNRLISNTALSHYISTWTSRELETLPLPKFSTAEKKCKLHQRLSKSRFKSKGGLVRKELSNPPTTHTWITPHDMCLSVKSSLWFFNDDDWGESSYVIWSHHEQIRKWLLPRYHLRCKL